MSLAEAMQKAGLETGELYLSRAKLRPASVLKLLAVQSSFVLLPSLVLLNGMALIFTFLVLATNIRRDVIWLVWQIVGEGSAVILALGICVLLLGWLLMITFARYAVRLQGQARFVASDLCLRFWLRRDVDFSSVGIRKMGRESRYVIVLTTRCRLGKLAIPCEFVITVTDQPERIRQLAAAL